MQNLNISSLKSEKLAFVQAMRSAPKNLPDAIAHLADGFSQRAGRELLDAQISQDRAQIRAASRPTGAAIGDFARALPMGDSRVLDDQIRQASASGREDLARALTASSATGGGFAIPDDLWGEFIEFLRPISVVRSFGPRIVPEPNGSIDLLKVTAGGTSTYGSENVVSITQPSFGLARLSRRKTTAMVIASGDLWRSSSRMASLVVQRDLVAATASAEDAAFLYGDGTADKPLGIRNQAKTANLIASTGATLAAIDADLDSMEYALAATSVPMTNCGWVLNPRTAIFLKTLRGSGGQKAYPEMSSGYLRGWPYKFTANVPLNGSSQAEILFVDWDQVAVGDYPIIINVSNAASYVLNGSTVSAFSQDQVACRVIGQSDIKMMHDEAVVVLTGVTY